MQTRQMCKNNAVRAFELHMEIDGLMLAWRKNFAAGSPLICNYPGAIQSAREELEAVSAEVALKKAAAANNDWMELRLEDYQAIWREWTQ
jgi:hypothetical protein